MVERNLIQEPLKITSKNVIGWLQLGIDIGYIDGDIKDYIQRYINRTDIHTRNKELEDIFGGEEW